MATQLRKPDEDEETRNRHYREHVAWLRGQNLDFLAHKEGVKRELEREKREQDFVDPDTDDEEADRAPRKKTKTAAENQAQEEEAEEEASSHWLCAGRPPLPNKPQHAMVCNYSVVSGGR